MNTSLPKTKKLVSISEAAQVLGVSIDTIRRWDKKGLLHSTRVGKNRYFSIFELEKVKFAKPLPISAVSKYLGISQTTLRRWEKAGKIKALRTPAGTRFYSADELNRIKPESVQMVRHSDISDFSGTPSLSEFSAKSSLLTRFLAGTAAVSVGSLIIGGVIVSRNLLFKSSPAANFQSPTSNSNVLAVTASPAFLEINADIQVKGEINNLTIEASPSAGTFTLGSGGTTLTLSDTASIDQDVSTVSAPTFSALTLSAAKDQLVLGTKSISIPDATTTLIGKDTTDTLTNKTISGSDNTLKSIANSALSNSKVTVTAGTNLSGGGDVTLGSSVTVNLKDSVSLTGTLTVTGASTLTSSSLSVAGVAYTFPGSDGSSSTVLTTNGSGTLSWGSLSAAGGWTDDGTTVRLTTQTDNVGIGTSNPGAKLAVAGNVGIGYTSVVIPSNGLAVAGNVGIGTTSPTNALTVAGSVNFTGNLSLDTIISGTWNGSVIGATYGGTGQSSWTTGDILYASGTNALSRLGIGSAGQALVITSGVPAWGTGSQWTTSAPNIYFIGTAGAGNVGIGNTYANYGKLQLTGAGTGTGITFQTLDSAGTQRFSVLDNGNVGIGTTNPGSVLSVIGNVGIGTSAAGAALQVNGGGLFGWGTASSVLSSGAIAGFNGNVGVGTTSPIQALHVVGQCVTPDTKLKRRKKGKNGQWLDEYEDVDIKDIKAGDEILSLNEKTGQFEPHQVKGLMDMGKQEVFLLTTQSKQRIETTANHPYLTREKGIRKNQPKLSTTYEVDQSPRVEDLTKDSFVALANKENRLAIKMKKIIKRELFTKYYKQDRKLFGPQIFAYLIVEAINESNFDISKLFIDKEYTGYQREISQIIEQFYPQISIEFKSIGRTTSPAHKLAYDLFTNKQSFSSNKKRSGSARISKDSRLQDSFTPGLTQKIHYPHDLLMTKSYHKFEDLSNATWKQVQYLKPGDIIATVNGWTKISSIYSRGKKPTFDIEVEGTHNFVGNNIVAHNTYISGNIGIGFTSPSNLLQASSDINIAGSNASLMGAAGTQFAITGGSATGLQKKLVLGIDTTDNYGVIQAGSAGTNYDLALNPAGGNIGIGTTSPLALLHVAGQCVTGDTLLKRRRRRRRKTKNGEWIEEWYWEDIRIDEIQPGDEIQTLDEQSGEFVISKVNALMDMGIKTTFRLVTEDGKEIRTTDNHPYLVQLVPEPDTNFLYDLSFETIKEFAYRYYTRVLAGQKIKVTALKDEVFITRAGWNHLQMKARNHFDLITRYFALPKVTAVLEKTDGIFRHNHRIENRRRVDYWEFREKIDGVEVKILIRSISRGPKHFYSLVWRGEGKANKKVGNVVSHSTSEQPQGMNTLQRQAHQMLYTTFIKDLSRHGIAGPKTVARLFKQKWVQVRYLKPGMEIAVADSPDGRVKWEKIKSIEKVGREQVWDIEVSNTHNFVGNNIVAHNTYISGNVGIGFTSPSAQLTVGATNQFQVNSSGAIAALTGLTTTGGYTQTGSGANTFSAATTLSANNAALSFTGTTPSLTSGSSVFGLFASGNVGIGTTGNLYGGLTVRGAGTGTNITLQTYGSGLGQGLTVLDNGNVGIGTTNPGSVLSVIGNVGIGTSAAGAALQVNGGGLFGWGTASSVLSSGAILGVNGNVGVGTTSPIQALHVVGQCVAKGTRIRRRRRGKDGWIEEEVAVEDIVPDDEVLSLNDQTGQWEWHKVEATLDKGVQEVYRLETESGKWIETTKEHPYLTQEGWKKVSQLKKGISIATYSDSPKPMFAFVDETGIGKGDPNQKEIGIGVLTLHGSSEELFEFNRKLRKVLVSAIDRLGKEDQQFEFKFKYVTKSSLPLQKKLLKVMSEHSSLWSFSWQFKSHKQDIWDMYLSTTKEVFSDLEGKFAVLLDFIDKPTKSDRTLAELEQIPAVENSLQVESQGIIFLQVADILLGGLAHIRSKRADVIKRKLAEEVLKTLNIKKATVDPVYVASSATNISQKNQGVKFEKIVSIRKVGRKQTYDLQISNTHNFVGNNIVAHNTYISGNVGIGFSTPASQFQVNSGSSAFTVSSTGNVGIGSTATITSLLKADSGLTVAAAAIFSGSLTANGAFTLGDDGDTGSINTSDWDISTIGAMTGIGAITADGVLTLSASNAALSFTGTTPSLTSGSSVFGLFASGNVGVGTTGNVYGGLTVRGAGTGTNITLQTYGSGLGQGLTVLDNGNVGIGTTNPGGSLVVSSGNVGIGFTSPSNLLQASSDINIVGSNASLMGAAGTQFAITGGSAAGLQKKLVLGIDTTDNYGVIQAGSAGTNYDLALNPAGGNIGIGTTNPQGLLEVFGTGGRFYFQDNVTGGGIEDGTFIEGTNAGSVAGAAQIWNYENAFFRIATNNTERLRIAADGNVGIGDISPDYLLELTDATNTPAFALSDDDITHGVTTVAETDVFAHLSSISSTVGGAYLQGIADATGVALQLRGIQSSDPTDTTPAISLIAAKASGTGVVDLAAAETVFQVANNDDAAALTILGNGNVGIGTAVPGAKLAIIQSSGDTLALDTATSNPSGLRFGYDSGTASQYITSTRSGSGTFRPLTMWTSDSERVRITTDGNVGIGFTSPSNLLQASSDINIVGSNASLMGAAGTQFAITGGSATGLQKKLVLGIDTTDNYGVIQAGTAGTNYDLALNPAGGNVGIGTTSPAASLQVASTAGDNRIKVTNSGTGVLHLISAGGTSYVSTDGTGDLILRTSTSNLGISIANTTGNVSMILSGTSSTTAVCSSLANSTAPDTSTRYEIRDCSGTPVADYMEFYSVEDSVEMGDVVTPSSNYVTTKDGERLAKLTKSTSSYQRSIIGIVSDKSKAGDFNSIGYNIKEQDNPQPVALSGRVPVKVSTENGEIKAGDYITSSTIAGVAMKASRPGPVVGKALEEFNCSPSVIPANAGIQLTNSGSELDPRLRGDDNECQGKILVFVNVGYADPNNSLSALGSVLTISPSGYVHVQALNVAGNLGVGTTSPIGALHVVGQCVAEGTRIRRRRRGFGAQGKDDEWEEVPVEDIVPNDEVLSLNDKTGQWEWKKVEKTMDMGIQQVYRLETEEGKWIETTSEHPYLVREELFEENQNSQQDSYGNQSKSNTGFNINIFNIYSSTFNDLHNLLLNITATNNANIPNSTLIVNAQGLNLGLLETRGTMKAAPNQPADRLIKRSDNAMSQILSIPFTLPYKANWIKVSQLKVGQYIATMDGWEKIVAVSKVGRIQTYDLQIEGTHNFVGNNIVAHNTYIQGNLTVQNPQGQNLFTVDSLGNMKVAGTITSEASSFDVAEDYAVLDESIESGDVVVAGYQKTIEKSSKPYAKGLLGIVSTKPGLRLSSLGSQTRPVALSGKVPVKVSTENGPIEIGDYITSSSTPGVGMKATKPGPVAGKALEGFRTTQNNSDSQNVSGSESFRTGKILVFVNVGYADPQDILANLMLDSDGLLIIPNGVKTPKLVLDSSIQSHTPGVALNIADKLSNLELRIKNLESSASAVIAISSESAKIATASNELNLTPPEILLSSSSASLANLKVTSDASISGKLKAYEAEISSVFKSFGETLLGKTIIAGDVSVDGTLSVSGTTISAIPTLYLQSNLLSEKIDLFNGVVTIDKEGNITAQTISAEQFKLKGGKSAGSATIKAGLTEVWVDNPLAESNSIILLTPKVALDQSLAVVIKTNGAFNVKLAKPITQDLPFDYLIIGQDE